VGWPLATHAQLPAKVPRIGYLGFGSASLILGPPQQLVNLKIASRGREDGRGNVMPLSPFDHVAYGVFALGPESNGSRRLTKVGCIRLQSDKALLFLFFAVLS
jgi:hypothetical protein